MAGVSVFQFRSSSKKAASETIKITFAKSVHPIIQGSCSPFHVAGQGKAKALDNYTAAKLEINDILTAISKTPGEKGFTPIRHSKLPDSTILVFAGWK